MMFPKPSMMIHLLLLLLQRRRRRYSDVTDGFCQSLHGFIVSNLRS
jgi:hypothetical protein